MSQNRTTDPLTASFQKVRDENQRWLDDPARRRRKFGAARLEPLTTTKQIDPPTPDPDRPIDQWDTLQMPAIRRPQDTDPIPLEELSPASRRQAEWWKFEADAPVLELLDSGIEKYYERFRRLPALVYISLRNLQLLDLACAIQGRMYTHHRGPVKLKGEPWPNLRTIVCKIS